MMLVSEVDINAAKLYAARERIACVIRQHATAATARQQSIGSRFGLLGQIVTNLAVSFAEARQLR